MQSSSTWELLPQWGCENSCRVHGHLSNEYSPQRSATQEPSTPQPHLSYASSPLLLLGRVNSARKKNPHSIPTFPGLSPYLLRLSFTVCSKIFRPQEEAGFARVNSDCRSFCRIFTLEGKSVQKASKQSKESSLRAPIAVVDFLIHVLFLPANHSLPPPFPRSLLVQNTPPWAVRQMPWDLFLPFLGPSGGSSWFSLKSKTSNCKPLSQAGVFH